MDEGDLAEVAALLEDEYARSILRHTNEEPLSASQLMERCEASKATTYRRLDRLRDCGLVESYQEYDPDGHHYEVYAATLEELSVRLENGEFEISIEKRTDPADRMTDLFNELR